MNFREWLEQVLSKADPRLYGEKEDAMEAAWEASKAEERERVRRILTMRIALWDSHGGARLESPYSHLTVSGELNSVLRAIGGSENAEQIRKGE